MSTRALKLLQLEKEKNVSEDTEMYKSGDDDEEEPETKTKSQNIFSVLREDSEDEVCQDNNDQEKSVDHTQRQRKKKKKNKQKAAKLNTNEDIDSILKEIQTNVPKVVEVSIVPSSVNKNVLNVEHKFLNPSNELKRIFGSNVVGRNKPRNKKTFRLIDPKPNWSGLNKSGLTMNLVDNRDGKMSFAFEHGRSYREVQYLFLDAVESADPSNIINIVRKFPFHIDSLLQVCEICCLNEDWETATEMIERALFVFELNFHPMFSLTQGTCRLDYKRKENRSFYLALFQHLIFLGKKSCYRTSLEFCKLILSFDPDSDPLGILLMIDLYALKSEQYAFLVDLYKEWNGHKNLFQLPNFAFSYALSLYHLGNRTNNEELVKEANENLKEALLMYPSFLMPMLDKCGVVPDDVVLKHECFGRKTADPDSLKLLVELYIQRTFSCWKDPGIIAWVEANVKTLIDGFEGVRLLADQFAECRATRYRGTPRNIYRHLILSNLKELSYSLPISMSSESISRFDPLPPLNSLPSYEQEHRTSSRRQAQPRSLSSVFFQSLFPSFDPNRAASEEEGAGNAGGGVNLTRGVGALMEGLQELLHTIRFIPPPVENATGENDGDVPDTQDWDDEDDEE